MPRYSRLTGHEGGESRDNEEEIGLSESLEYATEPLFGQIHEERSSMRDKTSKSQPEGARLLGDESDVENNDSTDGILGGNTMTEGNSSSSGNHINEQRDTANEGGRHNRIAWESADELENQGKSRGSHLKGKMMQFLPKLFPVRDTYDRLSNGFVMGRMQLNAPSRFIGQGTDGVFRNLLAKPDRESTRIREENHPPSYEEAAADAAPEYWESTVAYPMYEDEVFVTGLPVGNAANLIWNILVTTAFQFVGFVICYLLHTSHAAKQGARMGLGITFIFHGWQMMPANIGSFDSLPSRYIPADPNAFDVTKSLSISNDAMLDTFSSDLPVQGPDASGEYISRPYLSYGVIVLGIFIIVKSIIDYYKVKQMEKKILVPSAAQQSAQESTT